MFYFCLQPSSPWTHTSDGSCRPRSWWKPAACRNEWRWPAVTGQSRLKASRLLPGRGQAWCFRSSDLFKCRTPDFHVEHLIFQKIFTTHLTWKSMSMLGNPKKIKQTKKHTNKTNTHLSAGSLGQSLPDYFSLPWVLHVLSLSIHGCPPYSASSSPPITFEIAGSVPIFNLRAQRLRDCEFVCGEAIHRENV